MPAQRKWRERGFKIQSNWPAWDKTWFRNSENRRALAERTTFFRSTNKDLGVQVRTLDYIKQRYGVDIPRQIIDPIVRRRKKSNPVEVLDAGAGAGLISAGIVNKFGRKVNVTALGLDSLPHQNEVVEYVTTNARKISTGKFRGVRAETERIREAKKFLPQYEKNIKNVKSVVSFFENYKPGKQYDVIIDVLAAQFYTKFFERTAEQMLNLLKPNGVAVIVPSVSYSGGKERRLFDPNSNYARQSGFFLKLLRSDFDVTIVKKVRIPQKLRPKK